MSNFKHILMPFLVLSLLLIQLMSPLSALADGETPPETSETEIANPTEETETVTSELQVGITEETLVDEIPASEATEEPAPATEETQSEEADAPEDLTIAEALEQAPEGTEIVVINEEGEVEPLATEEAAQIVEIVDPIWCPTGKTPGDADCTASHTTVTDLIAELVGNTAKFNGAGTIYFTPTYSTDDATFDGDTLIALTDLTIQGGWNGTSGAGFALSGNTTFNGVPLTVTKWTGNVTLNDIVVDSAAGTGITVGTTGDINLENVQSNNNTAGGGAYLNSSGNSQVTLTGANQFNQNNGNGLRVITQGNITLNNITANENTLKGVWLDNLYVGSGTGNITLTGTNVFNGNGTYGLEAISKGNISLNNVTANNNLNGDGTKVRNDSVFGTGKVTLTGTNVFNGNSGDGLKVGSTGNISLENVNANKNISNGVDLYNGGAGSPLNSKITITGTNTFNNNDLSGLSANANGVISLSNITANGNAFNGLLLISNGGTIQLDGVNTLDGNAAGLEANTGGGNIIINNLTANNSGKVDGAYLTTIGDITINCSAFNSNAGYGFQVNSSPGPSSLTFNGVTFDGLNVSGDYNFSGSPIINSVNCNPVVGGKKTAPPTYPSLPVNQLSASVGTVELDCSLYRGTQLTLPNSNFVYFPCPISDSASLTTLEPENLPEGATSISGFSTAVTKNGVAVETLPTYVTLSFMFPEGVDPASLSILFWNGSEWIEQSGFVSADGLSFQANVNFTGDFVLVSQ